MKKHPQKSANVKATNKKARHDYNILATYEAGMVLTGTEIKSIRAGRINLKDGFAQIHQGEMLLSNVHISPYDQGNQFNHDPLRNRKLLLHKKEIAKIAGQLQNKGITVVPLKVYLKHGFAKVLLGVAQGKKQYDKRETIKRRDQEREIRRNLKTALR
ncbi:SsrA-binding protein [Bombilactobacillus mellifer]|uniref:SsrA-binding protein n=1 Tax=Bombilactobacillus mellifer TaxID=1218492 RepID=A0A0F4LUH7_9LACO|nr:SsrA-binding protein SmpB [Bombilactobacillus mellifer]MBH9990496.1 SsrA-binding protein SmpB [Lactobacillus sp. W8092]KJY62018.1 SsrA-binding protein [Bombilactobacillus mellifer]MCT6826580.1 SsrA-binding protein SmpB [Bombilactobacillus mellifer]MCT6844333.1 SsrA-binding protein SmpB [Bombilactobacillus mellifer]MCT6895019.1 SsrA-binding protein SmpB [Bombilactobacillus mellifer]